MTAPKFKKANVFFKNAKYNYSTSVNGKLTDAEIIDYFKGKMFNLGAPDQKDNVVRCIDCTVEPSNL